MKNKRAIILSCALLGVIPGCASDFEEDYREPDLFLISKPGETLTMPADQRAILVRPKPGDQVLDTKSGKLQDGGSTVVCAEPVPDVMLSSLAKISGKLAASADAVGDTAKPSVSAEYANELTVTAGALAGRNSTVLLTRDLLYRLCELTANYRPGSQEYTDASAHFKQIIEAVVVLAKADKAEADAKKILAKAKVDTLSDKMWEGSVDRAEIKSKKIDLIVAKVTENKKISTKKVDELIVKAEKEAEKFSADGKQKLTGAAAIAAANDDVQTFRDELIEITTTDLEALWKAAQKP